MAHLHGEVSNSLWAVLTEWDKGYEVVHVFKDDMSGSVARRPAMDAMLKFLRGVRKHSHVVVIDDISRLARGIDAHLQLRAEIGATGAALESPSIEFGEDSDSKLVENLLACVGKHEPLVSIETFNEIQERLKGKARGAARADVSGDFPLRGHICCPSCGHALTANWSKGRMGAAYPYYLCRQRECDVRGK